MDMPKVGDHLIVEHTEHGGRSRVEVTVVKTARYRFTVEPRVLTERLPVYYTDWDVRTGTSWGYKGNYAPSIGTEGEWADHDRRSTAWSMVGRKFGFRAWDLRGDLRKAAEADPVRFAAVLEQFITDVNEEQQ
jgi:hypothetical protein